MTATDWEVLTWLSWSWAWWFYRANCVSDSNEEFKEDDRMVKWWSCKSIQDVLVAFTMTTECQLEVLEWRSWSWDEKWNQNWNSREILPEMKSCGTASSEIVWTHAVLNVLISLGIPRKTSISTTAMAVWRRAFRSENKVATISGIPTESRDDFYETSPGDFSTFFQGQWNLTSKQRCESSKSARLIKSEMRVADNLHEAPRPRAFWSIIAGISFVDKFPWRALRVLTFKDRHRACCSPRPLLGFSVSFLEGDEEIPTAKAEKSFPHSKVSADNLPFSSSHFLCSWKKSADEFSIE